MEKVQSMISVMALPDRNYIRQTTVSTGSAVVEKSISSAPFFRLFFTTHLPTDIIKCLQEMLVQSVRMEQSHDMIPCSSKLTSVSISQGNKCLCLLQAGRSHVVICNDLWKEVWMTFLLSVLVQTDTILIVSADQSVYKAEILTQFITNSMWCQNLMA